MRGFSEIRSGNRGTLGDSMHPSRLAFLPLFLAPIADGAIRGPYAVDPHTVHLFHLDETPGATVAANAISGNPSAIPFDGSSISGTWPSSQPSASGVLGAASGPPGFGSAASIPGGHLGIGLDANGNGSFEVGTTLFCPDAIAHSSLAGPDGSFTLEAIVRPEGITGAQRQILCTDSALAARGFQFRINSSGRLEFNFIATGTSSVSAEIPTTGPHAFSAGNWYHVALAFDGTVTRFYWTLVAPDSTEANLIGESSSETTDGNVTGPLVIGNEARITGNSSEGFLGDIDEVRISRIARTPDDFIFSGPDLATDEDEDGLPDSWELLHAPSLDVLSGGDDADHDGDGASDLAEYLAGSDPTDPISTPADSDADGLPDDWERRYFGHLGQVPGGDPDGDGEDNASELANGSAPNNRASHSGDIDGDGLPDAWEITHFGHVDHNGGSDPDGDGFGNLQELVAATSPADPDSRPSGTAVKLVPVDDGDHGTSEFGFAGSSAINTVSFVRSSLQTFGDRQFVTWYGRHQFDPSAPFNNTVWIGRRTPGSSGWEVFRHPTFTANDINDGHDVISFGIDGEGYMHLSWGMHGDAFHYTRSTTPVTGNDPISLGPDTIMTGQESAVTYPQFLRLPDGDLLFLFRRHSSGNGAAYLTRYSVADKTWRNVHQTGGGAQRPFISGMWAPAFDYNPYVNMPRLGGADGNELTLVFNWRYLPVNGPGAPGSPGGFSGYQTNNRLNFARSPDAGLTWFRSDGAPYTLPITRDGEAGPESTAEVIVDIPEGASLINQAGMCLDSSGNPVTATWWAPGAGDGDHRRQYMVVFRHDDGSWQTRPVSNRTIDPPGTRFSESFVRHLGRPVVVTDDDDRIIVAYRDNQGANGLTIVHSLPKSEDPDRLVWIEFDLIDENLGNYEPIIDHELWDRDRQLHFLHQASSGEGYTPPSNNASRVSVLEWDAATYFAHRPQPVLRFSSDGGSAQIRIPSEPSWSYRLLSSTDLDDWQIIETRSGTGGDLIFSRAVDPGELKRFWKIETREGGFPESPH